MADGAICRRGRKSIGTRRQGGRRGGDILQLGRLGRRYQVSPRVRLGGACGRLGPWWGHGRPAEPMLEISQSPLQVGEALLKCVDTTRQ